MDDILNDILGITRQTYNKLRECSVDATALYLFYYNTAKWQKTNQPKATTSFCANGLKISDTRVRKAKKQLLDTQMIEDVKQKDKRGKVSGWYIKVKYIYTKKNHPTIFPQCGTFHRVEKRPPNALRIINKCLKNNNLNACNKIFDFWNSKSKPMIKHTKLSDPIKNAITKKMKDNAETKITEAIEVYASVITHENSWFKYRWTLTEFLNRAGGFEVFRHKKIEDYLNKSEAENNIDIEKATPKKLQWIMDNGTDEQRREIKEHHPIMFL